MSQQDSSSRLDRSLSNAKDDPFLNLLMQLKPKNDLSMEEQLEQYFPMPDNNGTKDAVYDPNSLDELFAFKDYES